MSAGKGDRALTLVVVDSDQRARQYLKRSIADSSVRMVGEAEDIKNGLKVLRNLQPDILLLEVPENATETVEAIRKIREELPQTGIILSRHDPSPQLILACVRAGAQEFVGRPVDGQEFDQAIGHVRKLLAKTAQPTKSQGRTISIFSAKGGVGCTSIAANLGLAISDRPDTKAVVVDLSFQMGDLALFLDQKTSYSLIDAVDNETVDASRLRSILTEHHSGLFHLTVATRPELGEEVTRQHMVEVFSALTAMFDYVVVDIGRQIDDRTVEVLDLSDSILMVVAQDVPSIRNTSQCLGLMEQLEIDRSKVRIVVNRFHKRSRLVTRDIEHALDMPIFWSIPNDYTSMSLGIDGGVPPVLQAPRSRVAQSFKELAETTIGLFEQSPDMETATVASE